jgi:hypothetical protein
VEAILVTIPFINFQLVPQSSFDIKDTTLGSRAIEWVSGGGSHNYRTKGGYKTTSCCTSWDYK